MHINCYRKKIKTVIVHETNRVVDIKSKVKVDIALNRHKAMYYS